MKTSIVFVLWFLLSCVDAVSGEVLSRAQLVHAVRRAGDLQIEGVAVNQLRISTVRVVSCAGVEEDPTEFKCVWQVRVHGTWQVHESFFAVNGPRWDVIG